MDKNFYKGLSVNLYNFIFRHEKCGFIGAVII